MSRDLDRRPVLKGVGIAVALTSVLPKSWVAPLVQSVVIPAHAAASPGKCG